MYVDSLIKNKKENKMSDYYNKKVKVELTIGEIFEIVGHLKDNIKANGGTDYTDDDVVSAFNKLSKIEDECSCRHFYCDICYPKLSNARKGTKLLPTKEWRNER